MVSMRMVVAYYIKISMLVRGALYPYTFLKAACCLRIGIAPQVAKHYGHA